jgi:hypothetical protein
MRADCSLFMFISLALNSKSMADRSFAASAADNVIQLPLRR